jgi:hypothetical protein
MVVFQIKGFVELGRQLYQIVSNLEGSFRSEVLEPSLSTAAAQAQAEAPVRTGFLRSHTGYRINSDIEGELFSDASYASSVNFGTSKNTRGTGFFSNAVAQLERDVPTQAQKWFTMSFK